MHETTERNTSSANRSSAHDLGPRNRTMTTWSAACPDTASALSPARQARATGVAGTSTAARATGRPGKARGRSGRAAVRAGPEAPVARPWMNRSGAPIVGRAGNPRDHDMRRARSNDAPGGSQSISRVPPRSCVRANESPSGIVTTYSELDMALAASRGAPPSDAPANSGQQPRTTAGAANCKGSASRPQLDDRRSTRRTAERKRDETSVTATVTGGRSGRRWRAMARPLSDLSEITRSPGQQPSAATASAGEDARAKLPI